MARRFASFATAAVLQVAALVLAHQLVFLARYGSRLGEALVHTGHGVAWTAAVLTSLALAAALAALGGFRLLRLALVAGRRGNPQGEVGALEAQPLLRAFLRIAPRTALMSVVLLSIQENVEHAAIGLAMPGPGILLSPEYPDALWITIAIAFAVSLVAALFEWRRRVLEARLDAARAPLPRTLESAPARPGVLAGPPVESLLGRRSALRAPPRVVAA